MRSASIHRMVASQHQPLDSSQKPEGRHEGSSRTTTCCHRHTLGRELHSVEATCGSWGALVEGATHRERANPARGTTTELTANYCRLVFPLRCGSNCCSLPVRCLWQEGKTNLSHDGLNPAHVPCWWVNNPTLALGCGWQARKSRHRRIKKRRRFERLAATSQLSLW